MTIADDLHRATERVIFGRDATFDQKITSIKRIMIDISGASIGYQVGRLSNLIVEHRDVTLAVLHGNLRELKMFGILTISEYAEYRGCSELLLDDSLTQIVLSHGLRGLMYVAERAAMEITRGARQVEFLERHRIQLDRAAQRDRQAEVEPRIPIEPID
jgi:hypothetical protein